MANVVTQDRAKLWRVTGSALLISLCCGLADWRARIGNGIVRHDEALLVRGTLHAKGLPPFPAAGGLQGFTRSDRGVRLSRGCASGTLWFPEGAHPSRGTEPA